MLVYYYSFLLYLCVDVCYDTHKLPYKNLEKSGIHVVNESTFYRLLSSEVCNYCEEKWKDSFVGNASEYTQFFFFSRETGLNYTEIYPGNESSLNESGFNISKETKILIHGWHDSALIHFGAQMRDAYLEAEDVNVIALDWSRLAYEFYPISRVAVDPIGRYLAQLLDWLVSDMGVSEDSIHLVGHSLGAHIAGVAGEHVTCSPLHRISGLDPAGPGFDWQKDGRLDSSDATFVDVIHTSGWWTGYFDPCGHVDFYPNGGIPNQPGCPVDLGTCSHIRSYKLFAESIASEGFVARACDGWWDYRRGQCSNNSEAVMGEHVEQSAGGKYYLRTASSYPYALGG